MYGGPEVQILSTIYSMQKHTKHGNDNQKSKTNEKENIVFQKSKQNSETKKHYLKKRNINQYKMLKNETQ